ncbi:MAG: LysE family transporter [Candidatus Eisenbacteria bacterium]
MLGFLAIFWTSFLIGFSGALVPGPVLTVTIKEAGRRGARAGPLVTLGHGIAEIGITVALILGVSAFLDDPRVKTIVAIVGGLFLIAMGINMLYRVRSLDEVIAEETGKEIGSNRTPILLGMSATLSNPYWFGWWGSIGATLLVASSSLGHIGIVAFITGHVLSDFVWYTIVSCLVSLGLSYSRGLWYKITFGVCGGFLVVVGILFIKYAAGIGS